MAKIIHLKVSDQIANDPECMRYARKIDPVNYADLYQDTWLKLREHEIRNPGFELIRYKTYFYRALMNMHRDRVKKSNNYRDILEGFGVLEFIDRLGVPDKDKIPCQAFLEDWISERHADETQIFYRDIIILVLGCKDVTDAIAMAEVSRAKFYEYKEQAEKQLINDYNRNADIDHVRGHSMV